MRAGSVKVIGTVAAAVAVALAVASSGYARQAPVAQQRRTVDGKPDLSGVWQAFTTATWNLQGHNAEKGMPGGQGIVEGVEIPYQPWAAAKKAENYKNRMKADPVRKCFMPGVPRMNYMPFPFQIVQSPTITVMTYEYNHMVRWIPTDGSRHPEALDFWMGDSRGRWEGDTFVVDVSNNNDETWFDGAGNFHSDALHVVERYTLMGANHLNYEATIEDPKVFTRPWKIRFPLYRRLEKNVQVLDYECNQFESKFLAWDEVPAPGLPSPPGR